MNTRPVVQLGLRITVRMVPRILIIVVFPVWRAAGPRQAHAYKARGGEDSAPPVSPRRAVQALRKRPRAVHVGAS